MARMILALVLLGIIGLVNSEPLRADVLLIEEVRQSEQMHLPANGASMDEVRSQYGDPESTSGAVGDPPITRWNYDSWSVYFERDVVLFTVLHKGAVIDQTQESG